MAACPTMNGVVRCGPPRYRQHSDSGCDNPDASAPSARVSSAGHGQGLVERCRRGAEAFLVFTHADRDLSTIGCGRAIRCLASNPRLQPGEGRIDVTPKLSHPAL